MKKSIAVAITLFFIAYGSYAQIGKGTILLSGKSDLNFSSYSKDAGDYSEFSVGLHGGYFVIDNLAVGLNLSVENNSLLDVTAIGVGPLARYYFDGKIFAGAGITILSSDGFSATAIPLEVGYAAFLNDFVAIEPALSFMSLGGDASGSVFGVNVGISVYLNRK